MKFSVALEWADRRATQLKHMLIKSISACFQEVSSRNAATQMGLGCHQPCGSVRFDDAKFPTQALQISPFTSKRSQEPPRLARMSFHGASNALNAKIMLFPSTVLDQEAIQKFINPKKEGRLTIT